MIYLEGYEIIKEIHRGLSFTLFSGRHIRTSRPVILKYFQIENLSPSDLIKFARECDKLIALKSDHIVSIYAKRLRTAGKVSGASGIGLLLVYENLHWMSLREYLLLKDIDTREFLNIAIQLAAAVRDLHKAGVIHKEIKPAAIAVNSETTTVKICDFSPFHKIRHSPVILNKPIMEDIDPDMESTLPYISPEQSGPVSQGVDFRTDFYSLGITFYEILVGEPPFKPGDAKTIIHSHIARKAVPPAKKKTGIPKVVSEIVMKMISKNPEDRYQSAFGIKTDLENCLEQLNRLNKIDYFKPGLRDTPEQLHLPGKIYGRDKELGILKKGFKRVRKGKVEWVMVAGYSGVGKSRLVSEIASYVGKSANTLTGEVPYFVSGKYDQYKKNVPYDGLFQAIRKLIRQILTESPDRISKWRGKLLSALELNGQIIVDVIPELEFIIGKQPAILELGPTETRNRFNLTVENFIKVFTTAEHPLVLFLDDLHWADSASFHLLRTLCTGSSAKYMYLLGAYRDNEVGEEHQLVRMTDFFEKNGINLRTIRLEPLGSEDIAGLIADTFKQEIKDVLPLSQIIFEKTGGNPFFAGQFIQSLHSEKHLGYDFDEGIWKWNEEKIKAEDVTENVAELMSRRLMKLGGQTREILKIASCMGSCFDLLTLSSMCRMEAEDTASELWIAVEEGLVVPVSEQSHGRVQYDFLHDRIQQAAYIMIPETRRKELHLETGRLFLEQTPESELEDRIFNITDQLNQGSELIEDRAEKDNLARLNLIAGRKSRESTAYESAYEFYRQGTALLSGDSWDTSYDLALALHTECGEAGSMTGAHEQAEEFFEIVLDKAKTVLDKIRVYELRMLNYTASFRSEEAFRLGRKALKILNFYIPSKVWAPVIIKSGIEAKLNLKKQKVEELVDLPELTDPHKLAIARLLMHCVQPLYMRDPEYLRIIVLKLLNLSLTHGNSRYSAYAYITYGSLLCGSIDNIETGYRFGKLALKILEKFNNRKLRSKVYFIFGSMVNPWKNHIRENHVYFHTSYRSGIETGDLAYASYAIIHYITYSFFAGEPLEEIREKCENYTEKIEKLRQMVSSQDLRFWHQLIANLAGDTGDRFKVRGAIFDENKIVPEWRRANNKTGLSHHTLGRQILCYLFGRYKESIVAAEEGFGHIGGVSSTFFVPEYYFYYSLAMSSEYKNADRKTGRKFLKSIRSNQVKMKTWAMHGPKNFKHKYLVIEAELARIEDKIEEAIRNYDNAILTARQNGFLQDEAITCELAAKFYISRKMEGVAEGYMQEARFRYEQWGALLKVADLKEKYSDLFPGTEKTPSPAGSKAIKFDSELIDEKRRKG